jgi:hypothetical protein
MQVNQSGSLQLQENKKEQEIVSRYSSIQKSLIMTTPQEYEDVWANVIQNCKEQGKEWYTMSKSNKLDMLAAVKYRVWADRNYVKFNRFALGLKQLKASHLMLSCHFKHIVG